MTTPAQQLAEYLRHHVPGFFGPIVVTKFPGGQSNPTYKIDAASGRYVLRRKPSGKLLASAHAVDREFRVLGALHGMGVPVAKPLHLCTDESVFGTMFYVMEFLEGRVFWDPALPEIKTPAQRTPIYHALIDTLAAIHNVDVQLVGLADFGKPGNYFQRQLGRWSEQYRASETQPIPAMETLMAELPRRCPADDGTVALVHGDYRIDNLLFDDVAPRVRAVFDWELSTLGHPLADLGYLCMALRLPRNPSLPGLGGMNRAELGIPDDWNFVLAFSFFRLAAIAQGVAKRAQQGNASSAQAAQAGALTAVLAQMGVGALG